jgi:hypothetical protein
MTKNFPFYLARLELLVLTHLERVLTIDAVGREKRRR